MQVKIETADFLAGDSAFLIIAHKLIQIDKIVRLWSQENEGYWLTLPNESLSFSTHGWLQLQRPTLKALIHDAPCAKRKKNAHDITQGHKRHAESCCGYFM
jgi:hypothetical protein